MIWVVAYLIVGFTLSIISYLLQRNSGNVRKVRNKSGVAGEITIIIMYAIIFPYGVISDIKTLISNRKARKCENKRHIHFETKA